MMLFYNPGGLQVSQYVVSVESSSLTHHRPNSLFACLLCLSIDAGRIFRTTAEEKGEASYPVKHV